MNSLLSRGYYTCKVKLWQGSMKNIVVLCTEAGHYQCRANHVCAMRALSIWWLKMMAEKLFPHFRTVSLTI